MVSLSGCLMVIAWIGFASVGIFMARYMKAVFGEELLLGTKIWFTVIDCSSLNISNMKFFLN